MATWKSSTHKLAFPFEIGEGEDRRKVTSITLREPDVEALEIIDELGIKPPDEGEEMPDMSIKDMRILMSALSDEPADVLKKLHLKDFMALGDLVGPLLESPGKVSPGSGQSADGGEKTETSS